MAESKLAGPIKLCKQQLASYNVFGVVLVFSMLSLGHILISDLVVANLLMYSLSGMILLFLAAPFYTKVFLDEINIITVNSLIEFIAVMIYVKTTTSTALSLGMK